MAMVSNMFLGAVAVELGFHRHLRSNGGPVVQQIQQYAQEVQAAKLQHAPDRDYWVFVKNPPKVRQLHKMRY